MLFPTPKFDAGSNPVSVAIGDFDGDGEQDLAVANSQSGDVSVLLNQSPPQPTALLEQLADRVRSLDLPHGIENSLVVKLNAALLILGDLEPDNDHAAANVLGAFIRHVQAQSGKKIATADADALIEAAEQIITSLTEDVMIQRLEFRRQLFSRGRPRRPAGAQEPE